MATKRVMTGDYYRGKSVLITGAGGFIGTHLVASLAEMLAKVTAVVTTDGTTKANPARGVALLSVDRHEADWRAIVRHVKPDCIFHCAGKSSVGFSMEEPLTDFSSGPPFTFRILEAVRHESPGARFLNLSSAAVYGEGGPSALEESQPLSPMSPYGFHKQQTELVCSEFARVYGLATFSARIFSVYGPGLRRQVVYDVLSRALSSGALSFEGDGSEERDLLHIQDVVDALCLVGHRGRFDGGCVNVASGCSINMRSLAALISELLDGNPVATFSMTKSPGKPDTWRASIAELRTLGFEPAIPLRMGLRETIDWIRTL